MGTSDGASEGERVGAIVLGSREGTSLGDIVGVIMGLTEGRVLPKYVINQVRIAWYLTD